jgi:hypothetical protein
MNNQQLHPTKTKAVKHGEESLLVHHTEALSIFHQDHRICLQRPCQVWCVDLSFISIDTQLVMDNWWLVRTARWEPQEEGMMSTVASLSSVVKPWLNRTSRRKPNFRRWCLLASWHSEQGRQINCLSACSFPPAAMWNLHTTQPTTLLQLTMRLSISTVCCE